MDDTMNPSEEQNDVSDAHTVAPLNGYETTKFQKNIKLRHTIMGIVALPMALIFTVFSMIGVGLVFIPLYWGEFSEMFNGSGSTEVPSDQVVEIISSAGEFLAIATIFQFIAFIFAALVAKYVVSGRSVKYIFSPSTYRGFFAKFGLPTRFDKQFAKHVGIGAAVGVSLWALLQFSGWLMSLGGASMSSDTSNAVADSGSLLLILFVVPILAPIVEEILFRGYILGFLTYPDPQNSNRKIAAVIVSAMLFAAMHFQGIGSAFDAFVLFWTFLLGTVFGITYIKTGKITSAIIGHMVYNGITAVVMAVPILFG